MDYINSHHPLFAPSCFALTLSPIWALAHAPTRSGSKAQVTDLEATLEAKEAELAQIGELCKTRTRQVCVCMITYR